MTQAFALMGRQGDITYEYEYMSLTFGWTSKQVGNTRR